MEVTVFMSMTTQRCGLGKSIGEVNDISIVRRGLAREWDLETCCEGQSRREDIGTETISVTSLLDGSYVELLEGLLILLLCSL